MRGLDSLIVKAYLKDSSIVCRDCGEREGLTARFGLTVYEFGQFVSCDYCACGHAWPISCELCEAIIHEGSEGEGPCPTHHPVCETCGLSAGPLADLDEEGRCPDCHDLACEGCNEVQADWTDLTLGRCPACVEFELGPDEETDQTEWPAPGPDGDSSAIHTFSDDVLVRFGYEQIDSWEHGGKVDPVRNAVVDAQGKSVSDGRSTYGRVFRDPDTWAVVLGTDFRRWERERDADPVLAVARAKASTLRATIEEAQASLSKVEEEIYHLDTEHALRLAEVAVPLVDSKACHSRLRKFIERGREANAGLGPSVLVQIDKALGRKFGARTAERNWKRWGAPARRTGRLIKLARLQRAARRLHGRQEEV